MNKIVFLTSIILLAIIAPVIADECNSDAEGCVEIGSWSASLAVGAGIRTNPVDNNEDIPLYVLPSVSYNGKRFFIQNLDLGFVLHEDSSSQFNLFITPSYDQVFFNRWDARNFVLSESSPTFTNSFNGPKLDAQERYVDTDQLHKRRMTGLAGFEYNHMFSGVDLQLHALQEFTGFHQGNELRLSLAKRIYHGKHSLMLSAGANWQSSELLDYYYGIRIDEAAPEDYYKPESGISSVLRMDWNYQVSERWSWQLSTSYRALAKEIRQSPLIVDDKVITAFVGGVYHF